MEFGNEEGEAGASGDMGISRPEPSNELVWLARRERNCAVGKILLASYYWKNVIIQSNASFAA
jgi:hypothetical protein